MAEAHVENSGRRNGGKKRKKLRKRILRIGLILGLAAAIGIVGYQYYQTQMKNAAGAEASYLLQPVQKGTISKTVYGSGMVQAANQPTILANTSGTVVSVPVSIGDTVKKGQVLAVLENKDLDDDIRSLEYSLWEKDISISSSVTGTEVTSVKAPVSGRVMRVNVSAGDDALAAYRQHGSVVILSTDGRMKVDFTVEGESAPALGDVVAVHGVGFDTSATITDLYMQGTQATATILGDELPLDASVWIEHQGARIGEGAISINKPMAVSAHGGTVDEVRVRVGDQVSQKMTLLTLRDAPISLEMENLRMQRESIAESLSAAVSQREDLILIAPSDGVVASLNLSVGDSVQSGSVAMSIIVGEEMVLSIAVDELDVVEVEPEQPVEISVDALSGLSIAGTVEKIAPVGSGSGGVSTYDVSLNFTATGTGVMPGMNASGAVEVAKAVDVLYVPVEALLTIGNQQFVMVYEQGDTQADATAPGDSDGADASPQSARRPGAQERAAGSSEDGQSTGEAAPAEAAPATGGRQFSGGGTRQLPEGVDAEQISQMRASGAGSGGTGGRPAGPYSAGVSVPTAASSGSAGEAGTLRAVKTGIQNDDYVEILSGLSLGEIVMYQMAGSSSSSSGSNPMGGGQALRVGTMFSR